MSVLKNAVINGVWGDRDIRMDFHPDVNFLIGPNGSGKTTAINLIAAALTADYESLTRIPFNKVSCSLQDPQSPTGECTISVVRVAESSTFGGIEFKYDITRGKEKQAFELSASTLHYFPHVTLGKITTPKPPIDTAILAQIVKIKWLSVHRTPSKARANETPSSDSSVDRKLTQLGNQLVRYFSKLAARRELETSRFLKQLFPILLSTSAEQDVISEAQKIDLPSLQESIADLINQLGLANKNIDKNLSTHFKLAASTKDKASYSSSELAALINSIPMMKVVEEWNRSLVKQSNIAKPRREFLQVINSMFSGKQLEINQRNELEAVLPSDKHLHLSNLSSGEKQLLIIMAEALLQENDEFIYIADEPELSLHVRWQEQLTRNLRKINPKGQVIFATHSPDIVSEYANRVINMERLK
jgi:energy-coupling factor transporter ATP-binding protein EcfA2